MCCWWVRQRFDGYEYGTPIGVYKGIELDFTDRDFEGCNYGNLGVLVT